MSNIIFLVVETCYKGSRTSFPDSISQIRNIRVYKMSEVLATRLLPWLLKWIIKVSCNSVHIHQWNMNTWNEIIRWLDVRDARVKGPVDIIFSFSFFVSTFSSGHRKMKNTWVPRDAMRRNWCNLSFVQQQAHVIHSFIYVTFQTVPRRPQVIQQ